MIYTFFINFLCYENIKNHRRHDYTFVAFDICLIAPVHTSLLSIIITMGIVILINVQKFQIEPEVCVCTVCQQSDRSLHLQRI